MIFIAIGANIDGPLGSALQTLRQLPAMLAEEQIDILSASDLYETAPIRPTDQGGYINGAISISSRALPQALLATLKRLEIRAGRRLGRRWTARTLDLDLISYHSLVVGMDDTELATVDQPRAAIRGQLILPHPSLHLRPFVLRPLLDIAPHWHHPITGETVFTMWQRARHRRGGNVLRRVGPLVAE